MRTSFKTGAALGSCLIVAATAAMANAPSSLTEQRGYGNCVQAVQRELSDLRVESTYYTNTYANSREFYLNARATRGDVGWGAVRIACETSRSGHRVLSVNHESGRYLGRVAPAVIREVTGN